MGEPPGLHIELELALGTSPVSGHFRSAAGTGAAFVGWRQLTDALEQALRDASDPPPRDRPAAEAEQALRTFQIRIVPGSDPVTGEIADDAGPPASFTGWLELAAMLDGIRLGH